VLPLSAFVDARIYTGTHARAISSVHTSRYIHSHTHGHTQTHARTYNLFILI